MLNLSLTFDYELFFGKNNGTYDEVLFDYTYKLIDALESKGVSATFFVDVCSVPVAEKFKQNSYVEGFQKQIKYMVEHGQDVQLHIHPHWYYSKWENEQWHFTYKGYRLHEYINDGRIDQIISDGIKYLNNIIKPIKKDYECIAYRAGGFSLQPHEEIVKRLYENGIRVDSSIAPRLVAKTEAQSYDYQHSLTEYNWFISEKGRWWENCKEGNYLLEIPIATIDKNPLSFIIRRLLFSKKIKVSLGSKRGSYITGNEQVQRNFKLYWKYVSGYNIISMDTFAAEYLYYQVKRFYKKNLEMNVSYNSNQVVALIGHPKLVTDEYIGNICKFIDMIKSDPKFEFISIYNAYMMKQNEINEGCQNFV